MERVDFKEWLDCNGWEDLTDRDENCYYKESTVLDILEEAFKQVKSKSVLGGVMICPKCDNPHPHRYKEYWSCEECGEQWGEA